MKKTYKKMLFDSWANIERAYKRNLKDQTYSSKGFIYVYDNFHVLNKSFDECKFSARKGKKDPPILFVYIYNHLYEKNFSLSEEEFFSFLNSLGKEHYLTYKELFSVSSTISAACIYEVGRICAPTKNESENLGLKNLHTAISLLREKETWDFEKIISNISKTETCFLEFEPSFSIMDNETKNKYRETISDFCRAEKISEKDASDILRTYCIENDVTVGELLFKEEKKTAILFTFLSALFTVFVTYISVNFIGSPLSVLAIPSFILTSMSFADIVMSASEKVTSCPKLELEEIPDEGKTAVVISDLITSFDENIKLSTNLERFYLLNRDRNICFTVLLDFPQGKTELPTDKESEILKDLFDKIDTLNEKYENRFSALARNRKYYTDENVFYGEERKRGAITRLVEFITDKKRFDYSAGNTDILSDVKFLFLLDSDTGIGMSAVKEMVSCALHPMNKPIIEGNKVVKGYGVFQPAIKFQLVHKKKTDFQSFISGSGGIDNYESASYDRFQSVFGSGIFCGKGLINIDVYKKTVIPSMPDKIVLSHDMPEGNFMRCRLVSNITATDDVPTNAISYFSRLHRWIRGDIQNLFFLKKKSSHHFKMSSYSNFKILNNVIRHITPITSLALLTMSGFLNSKLAFCGIFFSLLYLLFPFLSVLIFSPFRAYNRTTVMGRRFYSEVTGVYASNTLRLLYEIATLPYNAYVSISAISKSLIRLLITKKKLLEWKTFGISEKTSTSNLLGYYLKCFINVIFGSLFVTFSNPLLLIIGIIWVISPFVLYLMSVPQKEETPISSEEKEVLTKYSERIWNFFSDTVNEKTNYLPPDNIQIAPTDSVAMRTSPTNIGFYLISCLAANDFGFISKEETELRISNTLSVIEKMEKWNGHLYNWYDLKNISILGERFVSTVDSGNFVTMLISLREGLLEKEIFSLDSRISQIIENTDFLPLYNKKKKLFSIGFNETKGFLETNCYDLLMSEARTTSYFAVATGKVPEKHWKALGRTLISEKGYLGMASWSGTMFEYFMPILLLPLYKNSFSYEALAFAYTRQKRASVSKLWGMSESGFYSFDSELNYQYKAHGVPVLSLKRYPKNELVLSPYSSFLTLCINRKGSMANLKRFKEQGIWGQYGFYESVDFTSGKAIVKSYMSHHMGMSIIAAANACFDNVFVKRFMNDKKMSASCDLLKERIPTNAPVYKNPQSETAANAISSKLFDGVTSKPSLEDPKTAILSSGNLVFRVSDCGTVQLLYRGIPINESEFSIGRLTHSFAAGFIDIEGNTKYAVPLLSDDPDSCSFEYGKDYSSHIISSRDFAASVSYNISERGDCFIIETKGNIKRKYSPFIVFEPQMSRDGEYYSGKSFACMKTKVEYNEEKECIFISGPDSKFTVCVKCDEEIDDYLTGRDSLKVGCLFEDLTSGKEIPSVYPLCYIKAPYLTGGCCKFYIGIGKTKEQSYTACEKEKQNKGTPQKRLSNVDPVLLAKTASDVLFKRLKYTDKDFVPYREELWKKGISGDYPIIAIYAKEMCISEIAEHLKVYGASYFSHLMYELFIFYDEEDLYFRKTQNKILSLLSKAGCMGFKDKSPGIHLMNVSDSKPLFEIGDVYSNFIIISNRIYAGDKQISHKAIKIEKTVPPSPMEFISIQKRGFVFNKGSLFERKPYSYVISGENFGSVVCDSSLGFTFSENSRLCKLSQYDDSPNVSSGEKVYSYYGGKIYDLCAMSNTFRCKDGVAIYEGEFEGITYTVCTFVSVSKKEKYVIVSYSADSISTAFAFKPLLGETSHAGDTIQCKCSTDKKENIRLFYNPLNVDLKNTMGFCSSMGTQNTVPFYLPFMGEIVLYATGQKAFFRIGERNADELPQSVTLENILSEKTIAEDFSKSFVPPIDIKTKDESLCEIFPFLFYQTASSRFLSKTGFYQNGGAFGFRDQLQDCLSLVYSNPCLVRKHLIRAASHQYTEGDVMHWWHELKGEHMGVRTTCSDDLLWLPYVTAKYVKLTGDNAVLLEKAPFLISSPLENKNERYEKAVFSKESHTLYEHCVLALKRGFSMRKDHISLMGICDWNDGFSKMGSKGKGQSLFTSRFLVMATEAFLPLMKEILYATNDIKGIIDLSSVKNDIDYFLEEAGKTEERIENDFYQNGQYVRAVSDDGTVFGIGKTKACSTDILCQVFAVLGGKNKERAKDALLKAFDILYEKETATLKLFSPPFDNDTECGGYINSYPKNVRENGGQYTHAAVWTAIGLIECGEGDTALKLLSQINPINRCKTSADAKIYKNEPFVLSADIYSGRFGGRGGWSWYTGAASWYSVAIIEYVLGLKFKGTALIEGKEKYIGAFKCLVVKPLIPYTAKISLGDYSLTVIAKKGIPSVKLDGQPVTFPITIPPQSSVLEIFF